MKRIIFTIGLILSVFSSAFAEVVIRVALSSAPSNLNPFYSTDANSQNINRLVHKSLIEYNDKMQFICNACSIFETKMAGKKQIVHFKLRPDLFFTDGSRVTSADVKKSWEYFAKNETIKSAFMDAFPYLEEVKIKSDDEFDLVFSNFAIENMANLASMKIVKLAKAPADNLEPQDILGCGEYVISKIAPLEVAMTPRKSSRPAFLFKVVKDETTLALKLLNKEIDLSVATMSPRKINWLREKGRDLQIFEKPSANFIFLGLNQKKEMFKDLRVRQALSHLIPREDLLKYKLKNTAVLSVGMFSPAFVDIYEKAPLDDYNVELAQKLLADAGYIKNKNGFLEKDGMPLEIDWKVSNNKATIETVEVIQSYFARAGVKVNMSIQEWGTFMNSFKKGNFDIVMSQWVGFTGPDMLKFVFYSENIPPKGGNRISYKNAQFDKLIEAATNETEEKKRNQLYKQALKIVNADYAYINLWHPNILWIGSKCLQNVELDTSGGFQPLLKMNKSTAGLCGK